MSRKKVYKLSTKVKSIINRKYDGWSAHKAHEWVKHDLNISGSFMRIILSLFKGNLKKIYQEPNEVKSYCDIKSTAMFSGMIKDKIDDEFLTGKTCILFVHFVTFEFL